MTKPMEVSFKGLGEPLRQIRELIKDLWYRNRQEEHRGDIELLRQQLSLEVELDRYIARASTKDHERADRGSVALPDVDPVRSLVAPNEPSPGTSKRTTRRRRP